MFRKAGEDSGSNRRLLLLSQVADLIQLPAAFVLVINKLEIGMHPGAHRRAEQEAGCGQRVRHGAPALSVAGALRMATVEGARCLGRDDIGSLEPGMRADVAMFDPDR